MPCHVLAIDMEFQIVLARQLRHKFLIRIRFVGAQFVIEMHHGNNNAEFMPQFQQKPQERNRINPTGDRNTDSITAVQQVLPPNVGKYAFRQGMHGNMLHRQGFNVGTAALGCPRSEAPQGV